MLLVVAIVGGAIFTTIQDSSQIQSTSGLANADAQIENFGVTSNGLEMSVRSASSDQLRNVTVSLIDPDTGETVYATEEKNIGVADTETVALSNISSSENTNTYTVRINYNKGSLSNLQVNGTVTGRFDLSDNATAMDSNNNDNSGDLNGPTAAFSFNTSNVHPGEVFSVDASSSTDNGSVASYNWDWTNNGANEANGITATNSYGSTGIYTVNLTVTDDQGNNNSIKNDMNVVSNSDPSGSFAANTTSINAEEIFSVDASNSSDSDGSVTSYEWDWTNDGTYDASGTTNTHSYSTTGNKTIKLRVTDDDGATSTSTTQVEVKTSATIETVTVSEQSGSSLYNYTVPVELDSSSTLFSESSGNDVRFVKDGKVLDHWEEKFDSSAQEAKYWVEVPTIPSSSSTSFEIRYGDGKNTASSSPQLTFLYFTEDFSTYSTQGDITIDSNNHISGNVDTTRKDWAVKSIGFSGDVMMEVDFTPGSGYGDEVLQRYYMGLADYTDEVDYASGDYIAFGHTGASNADLSLRRLKSGSIDGSSNLGNAISRDTDYHGRVGINGGIYTLEVLNGYGTTGSVHGSTSLSASTTTYDRILIGGIESDYSGTYQQSNVIPRIWVRRYTNPEPAVSIS